MLVKGMLFFLIIWNHVISPVITVVTPLLKQKGDDQDIQTISWNCVRRVEAGTQWQFVQSRGYPKLLNVKKSRCTWKIVTSKNSRIRLAFRGMDLYADDSNHCSSNYIEIIDETLQKSQARFCGKNIPNDMVSAGNAIRIDFQAQPGIASNSKGFSVGYSKTTDPAGFYTWQSFGSQKRPATLVNPSPRQNPSFVRSTEDESEGIYLPNNIKLKSKENKISVESVIGGLLSFVAILLSLILIWNYRKEIIAFKTKFMNRDEQSNSTESFPLPPQEKIDPFERIMAVVEPYPALIEADKISQVPSLPVKKKNLPLDSFSMLSESNLAFTSRTKTSSRPPSRTSHQATSARHQTRINNRSKRNPQSDFEVDHFEIQPSRRSSFVGDKVLPSRSTSRSAYPSRTHSRNSLPISSSRQSRTVPKLYLPETSLLPPREEDEPVLPPPLPLKTKNINMQNEKFRSSVERESFRRQRPLSRSGDVRRPPRSRSYGNENQLGQKWQQRSRSVSNLFELSGHSQFDHGHEFDRFSRGQESFRSHRSSRHRAKLKKASNLDLRNVSQSSRSKSFSDITNTATASENAKWTFLDPPNSDQDYKVYDEETLTTIARPQNNRLGGRTISRASSHAATVDFCLPPPLPAKKKGLNRAHLM